MSLVRWNPWREMEAMHNEMNRLFSRFSGVGGFNSGESQAGPQGEGGADVNGGQWLLPVDVFETPDALHLRTSLPGVEPQDVRIEVQDNVLTLSAERRYEDQSEEAGYRWIEQQYGTFLRSITLPKAADTEKIEARFRNGVIELIVPKKLSAQPRRIELQAEAGQPRAFAQPGEARRTFEAGDKQPAEQLSAQPAEPEATKA